MDNFKKMIVQKKLNQYNFSPEEMLTIHNFCVASYKNAPIGNGSNLHYLATSKHASENVREVTAAFCAYVDTLIKIDDKIRALGPKTRFEGNATLSLTADEVLVLSVNPKEALISFLGAIKTEKERAAKSGGNVSYLDKIIKIFIPEKNKAEIALNDEATLETYKTLIEEQKDLMKKEQYVEAANKRDEIIELLGGQPGSDATSPDFRPTFSLLELQPQLEEVIHEIPLEGVDGKTHKFSAFTADMLKIGALNERFDPISTELHNQQLSK